jgi:hypothetical protein
MNKEFIPYEQALELKELGFDEPCIAIWIDTIPLPLYQQVFRWFREKYDLCSFVYANTHISIELSLTEPKKYFYLIDINT